MRKFEKDHVGNLCAKISIGVVKNAFSVSLWPPGKTFWLMEKVKAFMEEAMRNVLIYLLSN